MFTGERLEWPTWKVAIRNKLAVDALALGDDATHFSYVFSRLSSSAMRSVSTFVTTRLATGQADPQDLLDYLEKMYGDLDLEARSVRNLFSLQQRDLGPAFLEIPPSVGTRICRRWSPGLG